jgi:hypothetical protein
MKTTLTVLALTLSLCYAQAQEVPMINDDPVVNKGLNADMFDFVSSLLGSNKMAGHMKCQVKTRRQRQLRKFASGEQWVETLEVNFNSNGYSSGEEMKFTLAEGQAKYGIKKTTNQWSGVGEDIKIELGDYYGHWLKLSHDGQGRMIYLVLGNNLRVAPCELRR